MAELAPFRGLRFDPRVVGDLANVVAPPYDVISPAEQDALHARSPYNVVRVELAKDEPGDDAADKYERAAARLAEWLRSGALRADDAPSFYLYDQTFPFRGGTRTRRGMFGALRLAEWIEKVVLPHEQTFSAPKADRLRLLRATRANVSPVFALYGDADGRIRRALDEAARAATVVADVRAGEERHVLRRVADARALTAIAAALAPKRLYLADGHHRYETALEYRRERRDAGAAEDGAAFVLAYVAAMQDPGLVILPTHRVLRGAEGAIAEALRRAFDTSPVDARALEDEPPSIAVARDSAIDALAPRDAAALVRLPPVWRELPVAQVEELLVRPAREAGAEITYTHDLEAALDAAKRGATSVLLRAVAPQTIARVADAGERLPQKTTYFHPKVPTGLVLRRLER